MRSLQARVQGPSARSQGPEGTSISHTNPCCAHQGRSGLAHGERRAPRFQFTYDYTPMRNDPRKAAEWHLCNAIHKKEGDRPRPVAFSLDGLRETRFQQFPRGYSIDRHREPHSRTARTGCPDAILIRATGHSIRPSSGTPARVASQPVRRARFLKKTSSTSAFTTTCGDAYSRRA